MHAQLWASDARYREEERAAARDHRQLVDHCTYAPIPVEVRRHFGCDDMTAACESPICD
jgi:hypothetical protein